MENPIIFDLADMQKRLFEAQKGLFEVQKGHSAMFESLHRWQECTQNLLASIIAAITGEPADSARPAIDTEALDKARCEIAELEKIFNQKPPEPEA